MAADREMAFRQENYFHGAARLRGAQLLAGTGDKCSHIRGGSSGIGNIKYGRGLVTADTMSNKTEDVLVSVCYEDPTTIFIFYVQKPCVNFFFDVDKSLSEHYTFGIIV